MKPASHYRILVIEDDLRMVELLRDGLCERGHFVLTASNAAEGERLIDQEKFDAIVLDIGLPGRSGLSIAERLRQYPTRPAIVMLTALNQEDNVVHGLDAGADDYLTKPFSFPELVARISSATRRNRVARQDVISIGPFQLDVRKRVLSSHGKDILLTRSEYLLFRVLTLNRGEVVLRRQIMQAVWGTTVVSSGALDTLVNTLREKLAAESSLVATVRGVGYRLEEEPELKPRLQEPSQGMTR